MILIVFFCIKILKTTIVKELYTKIFFLIILSTYQFKNLAVGFLPKNFNQ